MGESPTSAADRPQHLDENIDSVLEVQKREWEQRSRSQRFVDRISRYVGRPMYLVVLLVLVVSWIGVNFLAPHWHNSPFDPFPYPLLDGLISLASLVSTTVVLIAQTRQSRLEQQHTHLALQLNLMTEQKVAKIINLIEELRRDLPMVRNRYDAQAETYSKKTDALQVLSAIEEVGLADDAAVSQANPAPSEPDV